MTKKLAVVMLVLLVFAAGCKKKEAAPAAALPAGSAASGQAALPAAAVVKPVPAQLPKVVARVNGVDVDRAELDMAVKALEDRARSAVPAEQRDAVLRQVLDRLVGYHLLVQEARRRNVVAPAADVDGQLADMKRQFANEDAFNQMLQARGVTADRLRADTADTLAVNRMLQAEIEPKVVVAEADAKVFFEQNKSQFHQDEAVHASHILIRVEEKAEAAAKASAKSKADRLLAELKKGAAFAEVAARESQDPGSAQNGGDLGFFSRGEMVPAFEQAAFALKPGETSGVVETPFGFHIIRVSETRPGRDLGFDEVKPRIEEHLKQQIRDRTSQEFVDQLKAKGKVEILI